MPRSQSDVSELFPGVQQEVAHLCSLTEIRSAFTWFRGQEPQFAQWQLELARIAAPPFGESARGKWLGGQVFGNGLGFGSTQERRTSFANSVWNRFTPTKSEMFSVRMLATGMDTSHSVLTWTRSSPRGRR